MPRYPRPVVPLEAEPDGEDGGDGEPGRQLVRYTPRSGRRIPAGPREPASDDTDWIRAIGQRRL
jgi:hypothetical protein